MLCRFVVNKGQAGGGETRLHCHGSRKAAKLADTVTQATRGNGKPCSVKRGKKGIGYTVIASTFRFSAGKATLKGWRVGIDKSAHQKTSLAGGFFRAKPMWNYRCFARASRAKQ